MASHCPPLVAASSRVEDFIYSTCASLPALPNTTPFHLSMIGTKP